LRAAGELQFLTSLAMTIREIVRQPAKLSVIVFARDIRKTYLRDYLPGDRNSRREEIHLWRIVYSAALFAAKCHPEKSTKTSTLLPLKI
jgi:hypothetical protein